MRRAVVGGWIALWCAGLAPAQQFPPTTTTAPPAASAPIVPAATPPVAAANILSTRQTTFTIPFNVDPRGGASEVQLHVSTDRGASWTVGSRQLPTAGQFVFRAPADGEYWFACRTIDAQGRAVGGDKFSPELRVRVDTTLPKVDLSARVGATGEIIAAWQASDEDLVQESVIIEYQAAGDLRWQNVTLDPTKINRVGTAVSGEVTWFPTTNHRAISLRIVARDGAGNVAIINRGVYLPSSRGANPARDAKSPAPISVDPFRRDDLKVSDQPPQRWPAENEKAPETASPPRVAEAFGQFKPVTAPIASSVASNATPALIDRPPVRSFTAPVEPATAPRPESPAPSNDPQSVDIGPRRDDLPAGVHANFTTKKRFKLDYDSDGIPASDIAAVELWGTHDAGKTWLKWGTDPDRQSPFEVEVEQEGAFGFRVVLVHRNGMAGHTPRSGDTADIWVGVDGTQPVAKFGSVAYGKGASSGQLQIQWTASDDWLAPRPVTLSYSAEAQGPWTPFANGLANTGQYFWSVEPSVPRRIFLKLEVRDSAGNVAEDRLGDVIELEGLAPQGRIRGIE